MSEIEKDIYYTSRLIEGKDCNNYDSVYFSTNEHLDDIFSNFNFKNKKVLSVIGSGDQAFHFYNAGVKKLDLFDVNKLAFYYYYLRVWTMKYLNRSYPDYNFDNSFINGLLDIVTPESKDEIIAYNFWREFAKTFDTKCSDFMLIQSFLDLRDDLYDKTGLFEKIGDYKPKFYHMDITKKIDVKSKYDVIYTSNIHEYIESDEQFKLYRNNLSKLLNRRGIVIASNVMEDGPREDDEKIMGKKFKCYYLPNITYDYGIGITSLGYYFKKKRIRL